MYVIYKFHIYKAIYIYIIFYDYFMSIHSRMQKEIEYLLSFK